jgi:hypothetical protein
MSNPILIAVPPHLVQAVAELIANDGVAAGARTAPAASSPELANGWTADQLRQHYRDSSEKMRAFLLFLAQHAGEEVTSHEAAQAVGYPGWNSIAGMLGAAQRRAKNHFGRDDGPWFRRWGADDQARLKMPAETAQVVLAEAAAHGDR